MKQLLIQKTDKTFKSRVSEVVERKGLGHPDTLCDAISEELSRALCNYYIEETGAVQHHNVDKVLLVGGSSKADFGKGEITQPIELIISGRAVLEIESGKIPIEAIVNGVVKEIFGRLLPRLDLDSDLRVSIKLKPGSKDLRATFEANRDLPLANDTSIGIGYAPFTPLEMGIKKLSDHLASNKVRNKYTALGSDIKIMGVRENGQTNITIAAALIGPLLKNKNEYFDLIHSIKEVANSIVRLQTKTTIDLNKADLPEKDSFYLTVTGSSVEAGDDGMTGRGNRHTGLITPFRLMSMEASAGKNPVSHVGKIYNVVSMLIAQDLVEIEGLNDATCVMVSQIGKPITEPQFISIKINHDLTEKETNELANKVVDFNFKKMPEIWKGILEGKHQLY